MLCCEPDPRRFCRPTTSSAAADGPDDHRLPAGRCPRSTARAPPSSSSCATSTNVMRFLRRPSIRRLAIHRTRRPGRFLWRAVRRPRADGASSCPRRPRCRSPGRGRPDRVARYPRPRRAGAATAAHPGRQDPPALRRPAARRAAAARWPWARPNAPRVPGAAGLRRAAASPGPRETAAPTRARAAAAGPWHDAAALAGRFEAPRPPRHPPPHARGRPVRRPASRGRRPAAPSATW